MYIWEPFLIGLWQDAYAQTLLRSAELGERDRPVAFIGQPDAVKIAEENEARNPRSPYALAHALGPHRNTTQHEQEKKKESAAEEPAALKKYEKKSDQRDC